MEEHPIRVLVVDDDADDWVLIRDMLADTHGARYEANWVCDYASAIDHATQGGHDVCLIDYRLGGYNGVELLRQLARCGSRLPAILMTGQGSHDVDVEAMKAGAYDYISKREVSPSLLERSIRYALERSRMEDELFREKERAIVTLESIGDSVITTDVGGKVQHLNLVAEQMTGWTSSAASGKALAEVVTLVEEDTGEPIEDLSAAALDRKTTIVFPNQVLLLSREGQRYSVEGTIAPIHSRDSSVIGVVMVMHDVTSNREMARRLSYQAKHDILTGLLNRYEFEEQLRQLVAELRQKSQENVLLYLDLDQFKIINDTSGHFAGDQLLKQIAFLMQERVRKTDTIARLGGDEFAILLKDIPLAKAVDIAGELCRAVREFRFAWQGKLFSQSVSIGVVPINQATDDVGKILSAADRTCYAAKEKGGGRYHVFHEDDQQLSARHGEMQWMSTIAKALKENRFRLYYQPIVAAAASQAGPWYEVLIRLVHETGELVSPGVFLSATQRYNMMPAIDRWVIGSFFAAYRQNAARHLHQRPRFNINLSAESLNDEHLLDFIRQGLAESSIPPADICFEITETTAVSNFGNALRFIQELRSLGCKFALDDFGNGLSSFAHLKYLPVDFLKIDGSFVRTIVSSNIDHAIVLSINGIAHLMGMETIAEFVENERTYDCLRKMGVDYAQGFWIGKPVEGQLHPAAATTIAEPAGATNSEMGL